jgi:hypothetical protein
VEACERVTVHRQGKGDGEYRQDAVLSTCRLIRFQSAEAAESAFAEFPMLPRPASRIL